MFGARAESLSRYLGKGTKVAIEGKLRWSQWEREGQKRSKIEVIVDELEFMSSRNSDSSSYGGGMGGGYSAPAAAPWLPRRWLMPLLRFMTKISRFKRNERG